VEVEVDEEHAFVLRASLTANRHKTSISTDQLQKLFLEGLVAAGVFVEDGSVPHSSSSSSVQKIGTVKGS
jgi:hypothetical protein